MVKNKIEKSESITFKSKYIEKIRNMDDTIADELMRKSVYRSCIGFANSQKQEDIHTGFDGNLWIVHKRHKTHITGKK